MKHAYLIIAHNEYTVLSRLINFLDDERNDIYIHFDKKSKIPANDLLRTKKSNLIVLDNRVDIRWGHVSQIEAELLLFEKAIGLFNYEFFHIISGVHLPLYSQNYIHEFFSLKRGKQLFMPMDSNPDEEENKMHRYNFLMKDFGSDNLIIQRMWRLLLQMQHFIGIRRNQGIKFQKASNWVSITAEAVKYLLSIKKDILNRYNYTMCGDEFFIPSELLNSGREWDIEFNDRLLLHEIKNANAVVYTNEDINTILMSNCLFARKFSSESVNLINLLEEKTKANP